MRGIPSLVTDIRKAVFTEGKRTTMRTLTK